MSKQTVQIVLFIISSFFFASCTNNETTDNTPTLSLTVQTKIGTTPLVFNTYNALPNGDSILISRLDYYVSAFNCEESAGNIVQISSDIKLYSSASATNVFKYNIKYIPSKIGRISFLVGLDDITNNLNPTSFDASSPLSTDKNMYWTAWTKYRYIVFNGSIKSSGVEYPFQYHTGLQYRDTTSLNTSIAVSQNTTAVMSLDIAKVFFPTSGNNILYKSGELNAHGGISVEEVELSKKVAKNFSLAFSIE